MYKSYNTRSSGGYNTPGQFVSSGALVPGAPPPSQQYRLQKEQASAPPPPPPAAPNQLPKLEEDGDAVMGDSDDAARARPAWMKTKLGMKKISNRERRRRQNANLRRLLTPKNALMVLNEVVPPDQLNNFTVEQVASPQGAAASPAAPFTPRSAFTFHATLTYDGRQYQGHGDTKMAARNAAAEHAFREIMLARMHSDDGAEGAGSDGEGTPPSLPMIQLASFALHKLFSAWEAAGAHVPPLRAAPPSECESASGEPPAKRAGRALPAGAADMHPAVLLAHMRPAAEYRALPAAAAHRHTLFSVALDVDGGTFVGKAHNKKEARKRAARAACTALFNVTFTDPHDD